MADDKESQAEAILDAIRTNKGELGRMEAAAEAEIAEIRKRLEASTTSVKQRIAQYERSLVELYSGGGDTRTLPEPSTADKRRDRVLLALGRSRAPMKVNDIVDAIAVDGDDYGAVYNALVGISAKMKVALVDRLDDGHWKLTDEGRKEVWKLARLA